MPLRSRSALLAVAAAVQALALGGCLPRGSRAATVPAVDDSAVAVGASSLGPGDVVEVRVYGEPELSGVYQVGRDGDVTFPLCQRVTVGGLTANGAAAKLRECLSAGFMRDPQVSVLVKEYNSKKVFVFGEVQKPGTFVYEDGMSVVQAVTIAGGFTKTAARNSTSVTRRVRGQEVKVKVSVQDIALGKAPNFTLEPGDIVYVPESLF
jgi:polysaccharide export outer membrane protein